MTTGNAPARGSRRFSGMPSTRCSSAQDRQAPRQPRCASSKVDSGQPTVLAKPAINVMPVMALRESLPYSRTSAANAASYRPLPMPTPMITHAAKSPIGPCAMARPARPKAKTRFVPISTGRPPHRSIDRPAYGPSNAETTSASENAANTVGVDTPRSLAIGVASIAGR